MKAVTMQLSTGKEITMHEPRSKELGLFLKSLSSLMNVFKAFSSNIENGENIDIKPEQVLQMLGEIPDGSMEKIAPLLASLADMTIEEYNQLPVTDEIGMLMAFVQLLPKNFMGAQAMTAFTVSES